MLRKKIKYYVTEAGESPFLKWLRKCDKRTRSVIIRYIDRVASFGTSNNIKSLKDGIFEVRIFYGAGYRIYFAQDGDDVILLLIGGDKSSQDSDIKKAKKYWRNYDRKK